MRGKVGQPSVPLSLAPDGAYAIGIKVGRRRLDTLLIDFSGKPCARWSLDYRFPDPEEVLAELRLPLHRHPPQAGPARARAPAGRRAWPRRWR